MSTCSSSSSSSSPTTPTMTTKELSSVPSTLPTPPNTSHRTKRHQRRVTWTTNFSYHIFSSSSSFSPSSRPPSPIKRSSSCLIKPILKPSILPFAYNTDDEPKPKDDSLPLPDAASLTADLSVPISTIISSTSELRDLVNAYSVMTARLRAAFSGEGQKPPPPPTKLLEPLKENRAELVEAMTRDLGRVMVDPFERAFPDEEDTEAMDVDQLDSMELCLPSPQSTPVKPKEKTKEEEGVKKEKKRGMSAERVTYARDLCTTTHAVLRLLQFLFTEPFFHTPSEASPFSDEDLHVLFRGVIQIPLATTLPTPNARKSYALAVMTIQLNTLPSSVLSLDSTTPSMLSTALVRAIRGELGKEGKRGARGDGMRAIHNLCCATPDVYMSAFADGLLPVVLKSLLDPSLIVRTLAAHALAGIAIGLSKVEDKEVKERARSVTVEALSASPPPSPGNKENAKEKENGIFLAIRTTLNATEPIQPAQGPAWALSVIASLLLCLDRPVTINSLFSSVLASPSGSVPQVKLARLLVYGMRHKKSTVRALVGVVWRVLVYLAFKDGEKKAWIEEGCWNTLKEYVDSSVGVSMVASVLVVRENGDELEEDRAEDERKVDKVLDVLECLVPRGEFGANDTIGMMKRLFGIPSPLISAVDPKTKQAEPFTLSSLLAPSLFTPLPGLLSTPYDALHDIVNEILETQVPAYEDVPALTSSQMACVAEDGVWEKWVQVWVGAVTGWMEKGARGRRDRIKDFVNVWKALLKARVAHLSEKEGDMEGLAAYATGIISGFADVPGASATVGRLMFLRTCWTRLLSSVPIHTLASSADRLFTLLLHDQDDLIGGGVGGTEGGAGEGRKLWASWCAEVVAVCADPGECVAELFRAVEGGESRIEVWRAMGARYLAVRGPWEGALALLDVPFDSPSTCPTKLEKEDFTLWEKTVGHVVALSADNGIGSVEVADLVSSRLSSALFSSSSSSAAFECYAPRLTDILLSSSPSPSAFGCSIDLAELINRTMIQAYPPTDGTETECRWMIRSLIRFFLEDCEVGCVMKMCEGAAIWIEDAGHVWSEDDWEFDMLPLYEHFMLRLAQLPTTLETLKQISDFVISGFQRHSASQAVVEAFQAFWNGYSGEEATEEIERCLWAVEHDGLLPPASTAPAPITILDEGEDEVLPPSSPILDSSQESEDEDEEWTIPEDLVLYDESESVTPALDSDVGAPTTPIRSTTDLPTVDEEEAPTTPVRSSVTLPSVDSDTAPTTPVRSTTCLSSTFVFPTTPNPTTPKKPKSPFTPRTPVTPKNTIRDKENVSPTLPRPGRSLSFTLPPFPSTPSVKRKKDVEDEGGRRRSSLKKPRLAQIIDLTRSDEEDEEEVGEIVPVPKPTVKTVHPVSDASTTPATPRKRSFMDAVEVPTVQEVFGAVMRKLRPLPRRMEVLRKTASAPASSSRLSSDEDDVPGAGSPMKRRRRSQVPSSDIPIPPMTLLEEVDIPASDDSIILARERCKSTKSIPVLPSSDDDPRVGQVTPHHLISPAPRRRRKASLLSLETHHESDDEHDNAGPPSSPTRQAVLRRSMRQKKSLERLNSL